MIPPRGLYVDVTGKVHGDLPKRIPKEWSKEDLRDSADALKKSIQTRQAEQVRLGEDAGQRLRLKASALTPNSKKAEWKLVVLNLYEQDRKNH